MYLDVIGGGSLEATLLERARDVSEEEVDGRNCEAPLALHVQNSPKVLHRLPFRGAPVRHPARKETALLELRDMAHDQATDIASQGLRREELDYPYECTTCNLNGCVSNRPPGKKGVKFVKKKRECHNSFELPDGIVRVAAMVGSSTVDTITESTRERDLPREVLPCNKPMIARLWG